MEDKKENEDKILYDLLVPEEWPEHITILNDADQHQSLWRMITAMMKACRLFSMELIKNPSILFGGQFSPTVLADIINSQLSWQLAISSDGKQLAIARDDCIELRSILDDFEMARTTLKIDRDIQPKWRKMLWNHHGNTLVYANSKGEITVFVNFGKTTQKLVESTVPSSASEGGSLLNMAIAGLLFIKGSEAGLREDGEEVDDDGGMTPSLELLVVVGYNGLINTFQPSVQGYDKLHFYSMLSYYPCGIGAVEYSSEHNVIIMAGWSDITEKDPCPLVSCWRLMDSLPYWRPPPGQEMLKSRTRTFTKLIAKKNPNLNSLFTLSVSPDGRHVAGISLSGDLSLWHLPSCKLKHKWTPEELFSSTDSHVTTTTSTGSIVKDAILLLEVKWWSNQALIIVNSLHKVTVLAIDTLTNLLGQYSEPGASVTPACDGQFMMLECCSQEVLVKRNRLLPSLSDMEDSEGENEGKNEGEDEMDNGDKEATVTTETEQDQTMSLKTKVSGVVKQLLYFLTEMDKFKPPSQKLKKQITSYNLVCLKSMLPEECYTRKMKNEEYGEALALAQRYNLDCDLVYQHQWQKSPVVTRAAINDYLARITNKSWVLQECLSCVPQDFLTMREMLLFGLHCTTFSEIITIIKEDEIDSEETQEPSNKPHTFEFDNNAPVNSVQFITALGSLSEVQVFLCHCRESLLQYLDRLNTYEVILGGAAATFELYDPQFFKTFRDQNLVRATIEYAQDGNYHAVEALFNRHGDTVLPHRLAIIANFPETIDPKNYSYLLPEINDDDSMDEWEAELIRERDWVEYPSVRKLYSFSRQMSSGDFIYKESPGLRKYLVSPISNELLKTWYSERAIEIEEYSGQIDSAVSIITIGINNGIRNLEVLHHRLQTLYTLIYHCNVDIRLSLSKLQGMTHLEIVQLTMRDIDGKDFLAHFSRYCLPYISRLRLTDRTSSIKLLEQFMVIASKNDLRACVGFLKAMKTAGMSSFQLSPEEIINIGHKCILASERNDQLMEADAILECLPARTRSSSLEKLHSQVDELEDFLFAANIVKKYDVLKPVYFFKNIQNDVVEAERLIIKLTRVASRKTPSLSENGWRQLLNDIITIRNRVFKTLDQNLCYKIFSESLLCSGDIDNIMLASQIIKQTPTSSAPVPPANTRPSFNYTLPFDVSVSVVVMAAKEYINSASSPRDKEIELAKLCVSLIKVSPLPTELLSEINLINALDILCDFGITTLPINVRLCDNKLDIIRQVLDSSPYAYKRYDKIFLLSYLLGHSSESQTSLNDLSSATTLSEGKGYTVIVLTLTAMQHGDYRLAHKMCTILMKCKFENGWEICKQLGTDDKFLDKNIKLQLLDFSLCYCPVEEIQVILIERKLLNTKMLVEECHHLSEIEKGTVRQIMGKSSQSLHHLMSQGTSHLVGQKQVANEVTKLHGVDHKEILEKCIGSLINLTNERERPLQFNTPLPLCYHPFYPNKALNSTQLSSYSSWSDSVHTLDIVAHQSMLSVMENLRSLDSDCKEGYPLQSSLEALVTQLLYKDTHFLLSCLLSLEPKSFDKVCSLFPPSCQLSHQIPLYVTCLKLYSQFTLPLNNRCHPYDYLPSTLIEHVIKCIKPLERRKDSNIFVKLLLKYNESLNTLLVSQTLDALKQNIDVDLFLVEENYRRKTILGLARAKNRKVFEIAIYLASRYGIPKWDVFMMQLDWLMTESGFSADEINKIVGDYKMMDTLLSQSQKMADEFTKRIYNKLPSTRYSLLYEYYTYLQWSVEKGANVTETAVSIETNLRLLKGFKKMIRDVNYHQLMDGRDPLNVLAPSLWKHNVHGVAKLAKYIPLEDGTFLTAEMVYKKFVIKSFQQEQDDDDDEVATNDVDSLYATRLKENKPYISQLDPYHFNLLVIELLFTDEGLKLSLDSRAAVLKAFIIMCNSRADTEGFKQLSGELRLYQKHIKSLRHGDLHDKPIEVNEDTWKDILRDYDLSIADTEKVSCLVQRVCGLGLPISCIQTLLTLSNNIRPHKLTVKSIVQQTLVDILPEERDLSTSESHVDEVSSAIEPILIAVANYEKDKDPPKAISSSDVLDVLRPVCGSPRQPPGLKRALLHLMNKHLSLSSDNFNLLLLYQTQSILSQHFEKIEVTVTNVSSAEELSQLFLSLLQQSTTLAQLDTLSSLLQTWPNSSSNSSLKQCWYSLVLAFANRVSNSADGIKVITLRAAIDETDQEMDEKVFNILCDKDKKSALLLALISSEDRLLNDLLKQVTTEELSMIADDTTMEVILCTQRVPRIATTCLYRVLYNYVSQSQWPAQYSSTQKIHEDLFSQLTRCSTVHTTTASPSVRIIEAAQLLNDNGFIMEAGSLILLTQNVHSIVRTVSSIFTFEMKQFGHY